MDCFVFIDIILFSSSAEEHARRLERVLQRFDRANLQLHPGKCAEIRLDCETVNFSDPEGPTVYMGSKSARSIQEAEGKTLYSSCLNLSGLQLALYVNDRYLENGIGRHFVASSKRRGKAHCSRQQANKAEQFYAATDLEMLGLVWATKQFRCYLNGC